MLIQTTLVKRRMVIDNYMRVVNGLLRTHCAFLRGIGASGRYRGVVINGPLEAAEVVILCSVGLSECDPLHLWTQTLQGKSGGWYCSLSLVLMLVMDPEV